ncbi:MAG: hypothetical protein NVS9B3_08860 [Gemmatimonadaceae bacterium]
MSEGAFASTLRARAEIIRIARADVPVITVRVEMPEVWDTVRIAAEPTQSITAVKISALAALYPVEEPPDAFVVKLNGYEVLDEGETLTAAGARNGSVFLVTYRRRRPVR